jgi:hypothetical protein
MKGWKSWSAISGEMPVPVSTILTIAMPSAPRSVPIIKSR